MSITEPHPSVPKKGTTYLGGGRGGAGNYQHYKAEDLSSGPSATGPASRINLTDAPRRQPFVAGGRGGSGNMFKPINDAEQRMFQFDEEMVRRSDPKAPVYHIGRGGMANWTTEDGNVPRMRHDSSASASSTDSNGSAASNVRGALNKLTRRFL